MFTQSKHKNVKKVVLVVVRSVFRRALNPSEHLPNWTVDRKIGFASGGAVSNWLTAKLRRETS